jgi:carbon starvation protein
MGKMFYSSSLREVIVMSAVLITVIALVWLFFGYWLYGGFIRKKLIEPDDSNPTPAHAMGDGVDFHPASGFVLFGHHFSSIAGAGPIIGPIAAVAAFSSWGPAFFWILIGVVFLGAVHDYVSLMVSVRNKGSSIPEVAGEAVSQSTRILFQIFVWLALVLVIAVFVAVATRSLMAKPEIVLPTFGLIPVAMLFGHLVYRRGMSLIPGSFLGLILLGFIIWLGAEFPLALHLLPEESGVAWSLGLSEKTAEMVWFVILFLYGLVASILPVWLLLQPRDYIANWVLILGMGLGLIGLFYTGGTITAPFRGSFVGVTQVPLWPMLFIMVACGAISGFHSLVASGTTAKQLNKESDGQVVGYGGMILEGALAILALMCVSAGLKWTGGKAPSILVTNGGNPIVAFAEGFGYFTEAFLGTFAVLVGMTMIKTFVMTTLDTSIRLARFVGTELGGQRFPFLRNRWVMSLVTIVLAFILAVGDNWRRLWPIFGASNQLVAALTLLVLSCYLVARGRPKVYTLVPAIFMIVTTIAALVWQAGTFLFGDPPKYLLGIVSIILLVLAIVVCFDAVGVFRARPVREKVAL